MLFIEVSHFSPHTVAGVSIKLDYRDLFSIIKDSSELDRKREENLYDFLLFTNKNTPSA